LLVQLASSWVLSYYDYHQPLLRYGDHAEPFSWPPLRASTALLALSHAFLWQCGFSPFYRQASSRQLSQLLFEPSVLHFILLAAQEQFSQPV